MSEPTKANFPQWMFDQPWDTLLSYITDARQAAIEVKLAAHHLRVDPALSRMRLSMSFADKSQSVEEVTAHINQQIDELLQTIDSLSEFRAAVIQHSEHRERSD